MPTTTELGNTKGTADIDNTKGNPSTDHSQKRLNFRKFFTNKGELKPEFRGSGDSSMSTLSAPRPVSPENTSSPRASNSSINSTSKPLPSRNHRPPPPVPDEAVVQLALDAARHPPPPVPDESTLDAKDLEAARKGTYQPPLPPRTRKNTAAVVINGDPRPPPPVPDESLLDEKDLQAAREGTFRQKRRPTAARPPSSPKPAPPPYPYKGQDKKNIISPHHGIEFRLHLANLNAIENQRRKPIPPEPSRIGKPSSKRVRFNNNIETSIVIKNSRLRRGTEFMGNYEPEVPDGGWSQAAVDFAREAELRSVEEFERELNDLFGIGPNPIVEVKQGQQHTYSTNTELPPARETHVANPIAQLPPAKERTVVNEPPPDLPPFSAAKTNNRAKERTSEVSEKETPAKGKVSLGTGKVSTESEKAFSNVKGDGTPETGKDSPANGQTVKEDNSKPKHPPTPANISRKEEPDIKIDLNAKPEGNPSPGKRPLSPGHRSSLIPLSPMALKRFAGHRRAASSKTGATYLPDVKCTLRKQNRWGRWQLRFIKLHNFTLFYCPYDNALESDEHLESLEEKLLRSGELRDPETEITIVPLEVIEMFQFKKNRVLLRFTKNSGRKQMKFKPCSKNPFAAAKIVSDMQQHLDLYREIDGDLSAVSEIRKKLRGRQAHSTDNLFSREGSKTQGSSTGHSGTHDHEKPQSLRRPLSTPPHQNVNAETL
mmetsp:Transcript_31597/g.51328  ORF Transcript_31597/g.51328 Transcript_31597/m.51328 type:complete len:713 (+) Transcript_31597:145-2283(+)